MMKSMCVLYEWMRYGQGQDLTFENSRRKTRRPENRTDDCGNGAAAAGEYIRGRSTRLMSLSRITGTMGEGGSGLKNQMSGVAWKDGGDTPTHIIRQKCGA